MFEKSYKGTSESHLTHHRPIGLPAARAIAENDVTSRRLVSAGSGNKAVWRLPPRESVASGLPFFTVWLGQ